jgi:hypothetical protein
MCKILLKHRKKCKISPRGLPDLHFALCGIKMNLDVPNICEKNNLLLTIKFRPLN